MTQNGMNFVSRGRGKRCNTCEALVNGAVFYNGCQAPTSNSSPAGTPNATKQHCMVNGFINQEWKRKSGKATLPRKLRIQGRTGEAVADASATCSISSEALPGGVSVNGATPLHSDQPCLPAPSKKRGRSRRNAREKSSYRPLTPPKEEEDWEKEVQEVTRPLTDWVKMSFGDRPYGDVMTQNGMNFVSRGRGKRRNTCEALVNGAVFYNGCQAPTSNSSPAGTPNATKQHCMVNGFINQEWKRKSGKATLPRKLRIQGRTGEAVADASATCSISSEALPGGVSVNGATPLHSDQPCLPAPSKKRGRSRRNAREKSSYRPLTPPKEEEDWEKEVQEVTRPLTDWVKMSFGDRPYGPEDLIHFSLRNLTLKQTDTVDRPLTANYTPTVHHPKPIKWSCYSIPKEPGQFADADD